MNVSNRLLEQLIKQYNDVFLSRLDFHLQFYVNKNLDEVLEGASYALTPTENGKAPKKHPHQWRLSKETLDNVKEKLSQNNIKTKLEELRSKREKDGFEKVYQLIRDTIYPIKGVGPLMVYDTALRIGAGLNLYPQNYLYVQQGAQEGLKNLLNINSKKIAISLISPSPVSKLSAYHLGNFLCIYRDGKLKLVEDCIKGYYDQPEDPEEVEKEKRRNIWY
ncbi:hypothetical protein D1872_171120 [compost metagenome]